MQTFVHLTDLHWGYERRGGHKAPLHDTRALTVAMQFIADFRPTTVILGGDMLDCAAISHHTKGKAGQVEGLRVAADAAELREALLAPLERMLPKSRLVYIIGNHEDWLNDLIDVQPGLAGIVDPATVLGLAPRWEVVPNGGFTTLGKLIFIHGDQLGGGAACAKAAAVDFEANVRFGHFHTFQAYTKSTPTRANGHTGIAVPCLCRNNPHYGRQRPNRWVQGFQWGYVDGPIFNDYTTIIINGRATINGITYR